MYYFPSAFPRYLFDKLNNICLSFIYPYANEVAVVKSHSTLGWKWANHSCLIKEPTVVGL